MICREFTDFGTAFYHSAVDYASLVTVIIDDAFLEIAGSARNGKWNVSVRAFNRDDFRVMPRLIQAGFADPKYLSQN